jgi:uncharacterized membrane protein YbhN (UPF0104 family)
MRVRAGVLAVAKLLVTAGLLWWVVRLADAAHLRRTLIEFPASAAVAAVILLLSQVPVVAWRWAIVSRVSGAPIAYGAALRALFVALFVSQVLPASLGGDAFRAWHVTRAGHGAGRAVAGVLLDRAAAVFGLLVLLVIDVLLVTTLPRYRPLWILVVGCAVGSLAILCAMVLLDRLPGAGNAVAAWMRNLSTSMRSLLLRPRPSALVLVASLWVHVTAATAVFALFRGVAAPVTFLDCLLVVPMVILLAAVPVSVGGWGVRELSMAGAFAMLGIEPGAAVAASISFGVAQLAVSLPGSFLWWFERRARRSPVVAV